jgi:hypothetical protein
MVDLRGSWFGVADEVSAGNDPKDWTEFARWPPINDGAAGDDDSRGFGESTDPNARGPIQVSPLTERIVYLCDS